MSTYYFKSIYLIILSTFLYTNAFSAIGSSKIYSQKSPVLKNDWTEINWKKKGATKAEKAWIRTSVLFDEWNFAAFVLTTQTVIPFYSDGRAALDYIINKNTRLKVQKVISGHVQVRVKGQNLWILKDLLEVDPNDWGYVVSKHRTPLRKKPLNESKATGYLSSGLRLTPIRFQKEFIEIEWRKQPYFIPFSYVISRLNFAKKIKLNTGWKDILFVMDHWIKTTDDQFVSIEQIQGIQGGRSLAYNMASKAYIRSDSHIQSNVLQTISPLTALSVISQSRNSVSVPRRVISTDQLFSRKIFDVASAKGLMLASANGIFRSHDGISWERLSFFENKNFPLAISPSGKIYVGPYRSINDGKSFDQYIRWDLVFDALQADGIRAVSELSIKDIEFLNNSSRILRMTLQMGRDWSKKVRSTKVISYDEGISWSAMK